MATQETKTTQQRLDAYTSEGWLLQFTIQPGGFVHLLATLPRGGAYTMNPFYVEEGAPHSIDGALDWLDAYHAKISGTADKLAEIITQGERAMKRRAVKNNIK